MVAAKVAAAHTDEWFAARRTMVTASVSSSLMLPDLPWSKSPEELATSIKESARLTPREMMEAGTHFELANMGWLSLVTGCTCEPDGYLWADPDRPWMGASPDGWYEGPGDGSPIRRPWEPSLVYRDEWGQAYYGDKAVEAMRGIEGRILLEMKQSQSKGRSKWKKERPPDYYFNQLQHQMLVLGVDRALIVGKVDAFELWAHLVDYEHGYGELLEDTCKTFWEEHLNAE